MRNRLIILSLILGIAALAYYGGFFEFLAPDRFREIVTEAGIWGPILVVVLFTLLAPFGAPGVLFILPAATLWPFWQAFLVSWLGATGAGMLGFSFARYMGRDWVESRMPDRLRSWDDRLSNNGLPIVVLFRVVFFLSRASHWALGLSRVPLTTAVVGTAIGFAPAIAALTYFGSDILDWFDALTTESWLGAAAVGAAIVAFVAIRKVRGRASEADPA